jgi:hypothetical protein
VTSWRTLDQRAREAELIWRGEQISRAIRCYAAASAGEPLEDLEQLVEASCLRRVYPDPMVPDGEWRILRQSDQTDGTIAALQGQPVPGEDGEALTLGAGQNGSLGGSTTGNAGGSPAGNSGQFGQMAPGTQSGPGFQTPGSTGAGTGAGADRGRLQRMTLQRIGTGVSGGDAIIGVMSAKTGTTLRKYGQFETYESWLFLAAQNGS